MTETAPPSTTASQAKPDGDGEDLLTGLPSPQTRRWDIKRKAQVVNAVRTGRLTLDRACKIYTMSVDEFIGWQSLFDRYGPKGLMATRVKEFRARRQYRSFPHSPTARTQPLED